MFTNITNANTKLVSLFVTLSHLNIASDYRETFVKDTKTPETEVMQSECG